MTAAWVRLTAGELIVADPADVTARLASALLRRNLPGTSALQRSWDATVRVLQRALADPDMHDWTVLLEYPLLRVHRRADVILLAPKAIFVIEFKTGAAGSARDAARQVDDYAQDLHDFHAGCRSHPVIPVAVGLSGTAPRNEPLLIWSHVVPVQHGDGATLDVLIRQAHAAIPEPISRLSAEWWMAQPYRPVPSIVEAARMAFARQAVPDIDATRAEPAGLKRTTAAILRHVADAKRDAEHLIVFVTGIPGAGKTRCGLAVAFEAAESDRGVFLTGNPTLVHVFREALARDAIEAGVPAPLARQRMEARIQALPDFRDHHVQRPDVPDEHVIIVDEAQRSWSRDHAVRKTQGRDVRLSDSEPGHILDAMARHSDWAVIVCLVGGGQEIHDGEGGLAEWGSALADRPQWRCAIPPEAMKATDPRQRIARRPHDVVDDALHLSVPVRSLRGSHLARWVDLVLAGDVDAARLVAAEATLPVFVTRSLDEMRGGLRQRARGRRRAGIVASAGARRLRADGLGIELPHMDPKAVARWFLDYWPDIRASDALEVVATEFSCQGLELDYVGLAWGGDLARGPEGWRVRRFHGDQWEDRSKPEAIANQINTYRVLLTRARYETIIWVPRGSRPGSEWYDATRDGTEFDAIAKYLSACGARPLEAAATTPARAEPATLL